MSTPRGRVKRVKRGCRGRGCDALISIATESRVKHSGLCSRCQRIALGYMRILKKKCQRCGTRFETGRSRTKACSKHCSKLMSIQQHRKNAAARRGGYAPKVTGRCRWCRRRFVTRWKHKRLCGRRDCERAQRRASVSRSCEKLTDSYVRNRLGVRKGNADPMWVELKRDALRLLRWARANADRRPEW